jgi:glucitol operon activator protein
MAWWQYALIAFVIAWVLQSFGVWRQTQHYQDIFAELRKGWADGLLGAGAAPAKLGKGTIALLVVDPQGIVRTARVMQGRSVFAKFETREDFNGMTLAELKAKVETPGFERGIGVAISKAIEQIDKVGAQRLGAMGGASTAALKLA